jgi:hypothetical protein
LYDAVSVISSGLKLVIVAIDFLILALISSVLIVISPVAR